MTSWDDGGCRHCREPRGAGDWIWAACWLVLVLAFAVFGRWLGFV